MTGKQEREQSAINGWAEVIAGKAGVKQVLVRSTLCAAIVGKEVPAGQYHPG